MYDFLHCHYIFSNMEKIEMNRVWNPTPSGYVVMQQFYLPNQKWKLNPPPQLYCILLKKNGNILYFYIL